MKGEGAGLSRLTFEQIAKKTLNRQSFVLFFLRMRSVLTHVVLLLTQKRSLVFCACE